jgi:dTDP-4-dehydrorhamnose 3,5-epimerase
MKFHSLPLKNAYKIELTPIQDDRGLFARTFCKNEFEAIGHHKEFVQFNHSVNKLKGTLRGMHYQVAPYTEVKLIRCIRGKVFDVIVDVRKGSATFLHWTGVELSEDNRLMMYVPEGFAHGFLTLTDHAELLYHHTEFYTPAADRGIRFDDPQINIQWPATIEIISDKDKNYMSVGSDFKGIDLA